MQNVSLVELIYVMKMMTNIQRCKGTGPLLTLTTTGTSRTMPDHNLKLLDQLLHHIMHSKIYGSSNVQCRI